MSRWPELARRCYGCVASPTSARYLCGALITAAPFNSLLCSHTHGHMCFLVREEGCEGPSAVFTGDALFVGGCGRWVVVCTGTVEGRQQVQVAGTKRGAKVVIALEQAAAGMAS